MAFNGTVRVQINGTWTNLTYNPATGAYEGTVTAPGKTSFSEPGGVYIATAEATNNAGTKATKTANLTVKETVKPVITIQSPTSGAFVTNNQQPIVFTVTDEAGGSGVKISSLSVKIGSNTITSGIVSTPITNGYSVTVTPSTALGEGSHTVTINCSDNDGNAAVAKSTTFTVDTVPPTLNVTSPAEGLITATKSVVVTGTTNDATSSPTVITINNESVEVSGGSFSKTITLTEGTNTITVVAKDSAGKTTTVVRHVTVNTAVPVISSVTITPNPANTGDSMLLKVVVTE